MAVPDASPAAESTPARQAASAADDEWYYSRGDEEFGPVDLDFLKMLVHGGKLGPDDLIWKEPMPEWLPVRSLPALELPQPRIATEIAAAPQVSGLAVFSLVLGVLWLGGLGSLLAVVLGIAALSRIRHSGGRLSGKPIAAAGIAPRRDSADVDPDRWRGTILRVRLGSVARFPAASPENAHRFAHDFPDLSRCRHRLGNDLFRDRVPG